MTEGAAQGAADAASGGGFGLDSLLGKFNKVFGAEGAGRTLFLWGILVSLAAQLVEPVKQEIANATWHLSPDVPGDPQVMARLAAKSLITPDLAKDESAKTGMGGTVTEWNMQDSWTGPDASDVLEAVRRGVLTWDEPKNGLPAASLLLSYAGLRPEANHLAQFLTTIIPSQAEAVEAAVKSQVDAATAKLRYQQAGGDPTWYDTAYGTVGNPPGPGELSELANRKFIPWDGTGPDVISFQQGIAEGLSKNKWEPMFRKLAEYLPPPRTVTALARAGSITQQESLALYEDQGLPADLAAAYVANASHTTTTRDKELTEAQLVQLYEVGILSKSDTATMLEGIGHSVQQVDYILELASLRAVASDLTQAVSRVRALLIGHKIGTGAATRVLADLGVAATESGPLIERWKIEAAANVRALTEAQITDAWSDQIIGQGQAQTELEAIGYTPHDAWLIMSLKKKAALPDEPPTEDIPPNTIPGT